MVAAAAQKLKESEITEQDSLLLTRNLLRIAIFNISYIRGLFPEKYFSDKNVPALEMKIKKLMPMDAESRRLIDWMEKGVYDALQKKYLKTLMFCVCETVDGAMIEEYAFSFSYSNSDSQEVSMNFNRIGSKKQGEFKFATTEITPTQMKSSACKMVRTLIQLMRTLDKMPEERTILMKLLYYDDVTPADYEPPFFRGCTEEETHNPWTKNPLKMEVGNVNSKHFVLALKVRSVLDPCEDDNASLGGDSMQLDGESESDSEASISDDEYIVAPRDNRKGEQDGTMDDEDNTQDPAEDEQQLNRARDWIKSYHLDNFDVADALSAFPDISLVLIEEIMDKLVNEGLLLKAGNNSFNIKRARNLEYEFDAVKDENDGYVAPGNKSPVTTGEGLMYMKALYHALPMEYITISKLQSKLGGEANQNTVRKLMDKMTKEGYIEASNNRRLGKRVVQSDLTKKKLAEVQKVLNMDAMEDANETLNKSNVSENQAGANRYETSTLGAVHSIGSDLTRTKDKSDLQQNVSNSSDAILSKLKRQKTPTSNNQPIASIESYAAGAEKGRNGVNQDEQKLNHARDWIKSYHLDNFDVADALSAFPDISLVLIEEILNKLVNEGLLLKAGNNSFNIMRNLEYEFDAGIDENDGYVAPGNKSPLTTVEGLMYMKALYHALPMEYINISKLQSKLGREANQNTVRKLMDKMTKEGYIEASDNLEKRVLQSDLTKKKLAEVQKVLNMDAMEDANDTPNKSNVSENQTVQSIRSDLTYTKDKSDLQHNVYDSNNQPIASIESYAVGAEKGRNGVNQDDKMDTVVCSGQSTLSKRSRKASTVKDLILQYNMKRQKVNLV